MMMMMIPRQLKCNYSKSPQMLFILQFRTFKTKNHESINPLALQFLTQSVGLSENKALDICQRFSGINQLQKPTSVVQHLKSVGFTDDQIRVSVCNRPQILCASIDNTLRPKIQFFRDLGVKDSHLGKFFSWNSDLFTRSLAKLVPCIDALRKIMGNDKDLLVVLTRSNWLFTKDPEKVMKTNVAYLMECGIVGSRLSLALKRQPWLLTKDVSDLRDLVSKVIGLGFSLDSNMLIHAIHTINSMTSDTLMRKFQLFKSFGYSEDECSGLFRRMPVLFRASEDKLKSGLLFFINTAKLDKNAIAANPIWLMYSMEKRVIPRYKVFEIIKSKKLLKKQPSFARLVRMNEVRFLNKFIPKYGDEAGQLLVAYKGHLLKSS